MKQEFARVENQESGIATGCSFHSTEFEATPLTASSAEEKFRRLMEAAPDAMVIVNEQGRIAMVNQQTEKMFGFARGELEGQTLKMLMPERFRLEVLGLHKSGRELAVEISLSPWKTKSGLLVVSAIRDVTQRKQAELLRRASKMKGEFLTNMAHELRTPLNGIIGFAEFLSDGKAGPLNPKQSEYLGDILESGRRLLKLIHDMLDLTRAKGDKMELSPVESDVGKGSTFSVILPVNTRRLPDHTRNGCHCEEVGTPIETTLPYSLSHEYPHR
jgi:signal transduction histidine kinase